MKQSVFFENTKNIIFHEQSGHPSNLHPREVHLWIATTDHVPEFPLSAEEQIKLSSMKLPVVARRFESTRKLLRYLFGTYLNCLDAQVQTTEQGKPFLTAFPEFHFNVTHSKKNIMVALSRMVVGIDLEKIRKLDVIRMAQRFFSPQELLLLGKKNEHQQQFFKLWTAKEAALKADGQGIAFGMKNNVATMTGKTISSIELGKRSWKISSWKFLEGDEPFFGAVATPFFPTVIHWYDMRPKNEFFG